jgi:hypothetical protein
MMVTKTTILIGAGGSDKNITRKYLNKILPVFKQKFPKGFSFNIINGYWEGCIFETLQIVIYTDSRIINNNFIDDLKNLTGQKEIGIEDCEVDYDNY